MLPPMAIFFPIFTILEDLGYLPRVAFNLDFLFKKSRRARQTVADHGDGLRLQRGRGDRHAGDRLAARAPDRHPDQQLRALQRAFPDPDHAGDGVRCGRFPAGPASFVAAGSVVAVVLIGVFFTLVVSWVLSRTMLKGEASAFTLELPPYRAPECCAHPVHLADRPHAVRAVAGHADGRPGGRGDLAAGEYLRAGGSAWRTHVANFLDPLGVLHRAGWRDPAGLHHRHPGQRDRRADHDDGLHGHGHDDRPAHARSAAQPAGRRSTAGRC